MSMRSCLYMISLTGESADPTSHELYMHTVSVKFLYGIDDPKVLTFDEYLFDKSIDQRWHLMNFAQSTDLVYSRTTERCSSWVLMG